MTKNNLVKEAFKEAFKTLKTSLPIMIGILLLINLFTVIFGQYYEKLFSGNIFLDPLIGAILGSISFGMPVVSYVTGGELLRHGVSLIAVTAFMMAWTTVGIVMLPLEAKFLGWRFAIARNAINFFFSILIAVLIVGILGK